MHLVFMLPYFSDILLFYFFTIYSSCCSLTSLEKYANKKSIKMWKTYLDVK